jgi:hypothetical protein
MKRETEGNERGKKQSRIEREREEENEEKRKNARGRKQIKTP